MGFFSKLTPTKDCRHEGGTIVERGVALMKNEPQPHPKSPDEEARIVLSHRKETRCDQCNEMLDSEWVETHELVFDPIE